MNNSASTACLPPDVLVAVVTDTVPPGEFDTVECHLRECAICQAKLDELSDSRILRELQPARPRFSNDALAPAERDGDLGTIGHFRVEEEIGRGAMGIVFRAFDSELSRHVAIKVLANSLSPRASERFKREWQAAANLSHDHLVGIHSVGKTDDGRPYLVMPLVDGDSLRTVIQAQTLTMDDIAEVVRQVATALAVVHEQRLIHRDVKSSNILVDSQGRARLTDFGLVKGEFDGTLTQADVVCGTPEFMSPEQARGDETIAASDIYGLGITLYECLTGAPPFRGEALQILEQHRFAEPVLPSRLNPNVPRDLETICLKAIAKRSYNRYSDALAFADDLQRFLSRRPIEARRPTKWQVVKLWALRNRSLAASLMLLLVTLVAGTSVSTAFWLRSVRNERAAIASAKAERDAKVTAENRLAQVKQGVEILGGVFDDLDVRRRGDEPLETLLRTRLLTAAAQIESVDIADPLAVAGYQKRLANSLLNLGFPEDALTLYNKMLDVYRRELGDSHQTTQNGVNTVAMVHQRLRNLDVARASLETLWEQQKQELGERNLRTLATLINLSSTYALAGRIDDAVAHVPMIAQEMARPDGHSLVNDARILGNSLIEVGEWDSALLILQCSWDVRKKTLGAAHPSTRSLTSSVASAAAGAGDLERALELYRQYLESAESDPNARPMMTLEAKHNLAYVCIKMGRVEEGVELMQEVVDGKTQRVGHDHPSTLQSMASLAMAYDALGNKAEAINVFERTLALCESKLGRKHPVSLNAICNLGLIYRDTGNFDAGITLLKEGYVSRHLNSNSEAKLVGHALFGAYTMAGKTDEALELLPELLEHLDGLPQISLEVAEGKMGLTGYLLQLQMYDEVERLQRHVLEIYQALEPDGHNVANTQVVLGVSMALQSKLEAEPFLAEGFLGLKEVHDHPNPQMRRERMLGALHYLILIAKQTDQEKLLKWQKERELLLRESE